MAEMLAYPPNLQNMVTAGIARCGRLLRHGLGLARKGTTKAAGQIWRGVRGLDAGRKEAAHAEKDIRRKRREAEPEPETEGNIYWVRYGEEVEGLI